MGGSASGAERGLAGQPQPVAAALAFGFVHPARQPARCGPRSARLRSCAPVEHHLGAERLFVLAHQQGVAARRRLPCDRRGARRRRDRRAGGGRRRRWGAGGVCAVSPQPCGQRRAVRLRARVDQQRRFRPDIGPGTRQAERARGRTGAGAAVRASRGAAVGSDRSASPWPADRLSRTAAACPSSPGATRRPRRARSAGARACTRTRIGWPAGTGSASTAVISSPLSCRCAAIRLASRGAGQQQRQQQRRVVVVVQRAQQHGCEQRRRRTGRSAWAARRCGARSSRTGRASGWRGRARASMRPRKAASGAAQRVAHACTSISPPAPRAGSPWPARRRCRHRHRPPAGAPRLRRTAPARPRAAHGRDPAAAHAHARRAAARGRRAATGPTRTPGCWRLRASSACT